MSSVNYDPDKIPDIDHRLIDKAKKFNMQIVNIICDEKGAKVGDMGGVSFIAVVPEIPRIGEHIELHDKTMCVVKGILWCVVTDSDGLLRLMPNVFAERLNRPEKQE